ncbi:PREDICTED: retinoic acid-induced protein 3 [Crocodylus porosus]|uniref:G protein-coupled receptor class C group 5 member A n=1 Tax=Crocodylus porosus TaxID=8502 RepID=A0A7M4DYU6_CROPO|nr:PREDICTED: retinoic acid-induced protein 3 [Crocodylus porosus]XP_019400740.1 PREDICTED: retinoic acid-induced protein 3 [Crocodylus porosus]
MAGTTPPPGCGNISSDYYLLCDTNRAWGIVLESLAAAGVVTTVILMFSLLFLICKVQDNSKRNMIPVYFLFLLGTLGIFGLTFAFIINLNERTGPTRFFLFGVLFALCFSCLLTHSSNLIKLVRGKTPISCLVLLILATGFTLVQIIIAIEYIVIKTNYLNFTQMSRDQRNTDFVMLLIYVLFLLALTFLISMFNFCGPHKGWKRSGAHILFTALFSIAIWVVWITMLMRVLTIQDMWDDPTLSIALVANGWVFLIMYIVPELCFLTSPSRPEDYPLENNFCQPKHIKQSSGMENRAYSQEEIMQEGNGDLAYSTYSPHFQLKTLDPQKDFSIPRPKTRASPYEEYAGGKDTK